MAYDISITGRNDAFTFGATVNPQTAAQTFTTVGGSVNLTTIDIDLRTAGSPGDSVELAIQADSTGQPTGTDLSVSTAIGAGSIPSGFGTAVTFTFPSPFTVAATTLYWCIFRRTGALSDTDNYVVGFVNPPNYAGGQAYTGIAGVYSDAAVDMADMTFHLTDPVAGTSAKHRLITMGVGT